MIHVAKIHYTLHQNPYHIKKFQNCRILFRNNPHQEHSIAAASVYKKVVRENQRAICSAYKDTEAEFTAYRYQQ